MGWQTRVMADEPEPHRVLQAQAVRRDGEAQRALMAGDQAGAASAFADAARVYAASWDVAPAGAYGRLIGRVKAAVLSGDPVLAREHARAVLDALDGDDEASPSPAAAWATALAALHLREDDRIAPALLAMRSGPEAFGRAADAVAAIADGDRDATASALAEIVDDFAGRAEHLTGVPIADTAVVLARLAAPRGLVDVLLPGALVPA